MEQNQEEGMDNGVAYLQLAEKHRYMCCLIKPWSLDEGILQIGIFAFIWYLFGGKYVALSDWKRGEMKDQG